MIICHSRKYIFIKTMKTAGTSLEVALSEYCTDKDVLSPLGAPLDERLRREVAGRPPRNYRYGLKDWLKLDRKSKVLSIFADYYRSKYTEHMPAARVRRLVGEEIWNEYYKFTIVRNPYDRFVSRYFYDMHSMYEAPNKRERAELNWGIRTPGEFIRYKSDKVNENWRLYSDADESLLDMAVRYEHMEEDLGEVSAAIGLEENLYHRMKAIRTKSGTRPQARSSVDEVLGPDEKLCIYLLCRREFELFGYDPGVEVMDRLEGRPASERRLSA